MNFYCAVCDTREGLPQAVRTQWRLQQHRCSPGWPRSLTSVLSNSRLAAANRPLICVGSSVCGGSAGTRGYRLRGLSGAPTHARRRHRAPSQPSPAAVAATHRRAAAAGAAGSGHAWPASCAASGCSAPALPTAHGRSPAPCRGRAPPAAAPYPPPP